MALLIQNGIVVNDDVMVEADVLVVDGKIVAVEQNVIVPPEVSSRDDFRIINAAGRYVIPGGIDPHTHLQMPFMGQVTADDFYTGTRAALAGGTTMIIDFVIPGRGESILEAFRRWKSWADPDVCCDYSFCIAITWWSQQVKDEMAIAVQNPLYGINSFKFFLAYKDLFMVNDDELYQGMKTCQRLGALARVHAENGYIIAEKIQELKANGILGPQGHTLSRPEQLEAEATNRACVVAKQANCPLYVVHVMSKGAARAIAHHRQKGNIIFGEPIAAGLGTDGRHYFSSDFDLAAGHIMSPPLSSDQSTPDALMDLLACNQLHVVGTDNCTFTKAQKQQGIGDFSKIPNGVNGLEDRMSVVWQKGVHCGKMDPMRFVAVTSSNAAKIFNIYPRKGRIAPGSDADIVVWNPAAARIISASTHHHAHDFNIFEGMRCHGVAEITICKGKVVWENGELHVDRAHGSFQRLPSHSNYVYQTVLRRMNGFANGLTKLHTNGYSQ